MTRCPICDQKTQNCDCTRLEKDQYEELEDHLYLFVLGEKSGNPDDWSNDYAIVVAESFEAALAMDRNYCDVAEIDLSISRIICHVHGAELSR